MAVHVTFIDSKGVSRTVDAEPGFSVMKVAVDSSIPEVQTVCGGTCTCADCHVHVDQAWVDRFTPVGKIEGGILSMVDSRDDTSRLSCQLILTPEHEGLLIHTLEASP